MPVYLKMDGVTGSAQDANHAGYIQADGMTWAASRNIKTTPGSTVNREGASISFGEIVITKKIDDGSFEIGKAFWNKKSITVEVDICRQGEGSGDISLLKFELQEVLLSSYETWSEGAVPMERFSMNYTRFEEKASTAASSNDAGGPAVTGYDLKTNTKI